jgi:L-ascorbate metabolism protein UlaG (beta-lactamase superfamily)
VACAHHGRARAAEKNFPPSRCAVGKGVRFGIVAALMARFPISEHCNGRVFFNPRHHPRIWPWSILFWKCTSRPARWPRWVELAPQTQPPPPGPGEIAATWINHATFLLQTPLGNVLTDPVYSPCCGPEGRYGIRRVHAPSVEFDALPKIATVLLSHDHYDHCDLPTLSRLAAKHDPVLITPLGNADLGQRAGFRQIVELDWWQAHTLAPGLVVTATPARHWSNRVTGWRNRRLWAGFNLRCGARTVHFAGDTAYDDQMFDEIRHRLGLPDLALLPIGAYEPRWFMKTQHCTPAEAVQIHRDLGAHRSVAMHWGCFQLADESREAPLQALADASARARLAPGEFTVIQPGESVRVG